ncbi:cupin domain-containing protein [Halegenticoccus soli]|uniref:cupin domain-containing protein n=1 Tax=Halegenticoccus soli TaxID=1985678 RepID=UPI000C6E8AE8|nr:cupin domain-containing protein [Halegenticoccus soli]
MKRVTIGDVESGAGGADVDCRRLSGPLGAIGVAINYYRIAPGEGFPGGLHAHADQEEIFVVIEGEAIFETLARPSGEITVAEGEAVRFAPGEFQSGRNASSDDLVAFAIGAPRDSEDVRLPLDCPECGCDELRLDAGESDPKLVCPACDAERIPRGCPECGHDDLRAALGEGTRTIVVCPACDAEFETPPVRE